MIKKIDLKEGAYYLGICRNTKVAKWFNGKFIFIGFEFNRPYIETISCFEDVKEHNTDGFIPIQEIDINYNIINEEKNKVDYKNYARRIYLNLNNKDINGEIWKPILNYEGLYYVSNMGRVKKHNGNKIMRQNFSRDYLILGLSANGQRKTVRVHRLVAMTFKNDYSNTNEVNHINGIKTDNRDINLEWVEHSENSKHMYTSGNVTKKLTPDTVIEIKNMLSEGGIQKEIAKKFNVSRSTISEINTNKKWKNIKTMKHL
jgi:predicted XRE-type DNA-binding protein